MTDEKIIVNNDVYEVERKREYNDDLTKVILIKNREMKHLGDVILMFTIAITGYNFGLLRNNTINYDNSVFGITLFLSIMLLIVGVYMSSQSATAYYKYD